MCQFVEKRYNRWDFAIEQKPYMFGESGKRYKRRLSDTASFIKGMFEIEEVKLAIRALQFMNHKGIDNKILNEEDEIKGTRTRRISRNALLDAATTAAAPTGSTARSRQGDFPHAAGTVISPMLRLL